MKCNEVNADIAELMKEISNLKAKNIELQSFYDLHGNVDNYIDKLKAENTELKAKLEDAKATAYAEMVDAGMRERRLRRLLWHAIALFCARSCEYFSGIMSHCLMGQDDLYRKCEEKKNKYLHAMYKCLSKAKEFGG